MKKLFSLFLSIVMVLCMFPISAMPVSAEPVLPDAEAQAVRDEDGTKSDFVSSVTVTPDRQKVKKGSSFTFTAEVLGSVQSVNWSVDGGSSSNTKIDQNGKLTVGADETSTYLYIKAASTFDSDKYDTALVEVVDSNVYITSVSVTPSTASVPKGGNKGFEAVVVGTDYHDVEWSISGQANVNTTISSGGYIYVSNNETASTITVCATSVRDRSKKGYATVTVIDKQTIRNVSIKYDDTKAGLALNMTGKQVTEALHKAIDYNHNAEGTVIVSGYTWTGLAKDVVINADGKASFTKLGESDELINSTDTYYFYFNIEDVNGYEFDVDNLPAATVNDNNADLIGWNSRNATGDVWVFEKVSIENSDYCTVNFNNNGVGDAIPSISVEKGITIKDAMKLPNWPKPSADGYVFDAWYYDSACEDFAYLDETIDGDLTLYAKWYFLVNEFKMVLSSLPSVGDLAEDYLEFTTASPNLLVQSCRWVIKDGDTYRTFYGQFDETTTYYLSVNLRTALDKYLFDYNANIDYLNYTEISLNGKDVSETAERIYYSDKHYIGFVIPYRVNGASNVLVTPYPASAFTEGSDYLVSGQNVTVYGNTPCRVGYYSGGKYVPCSISSSGGSYHTFTVPDSVGEVILVVKGDANKDGVVNLGDASRIKATFRNKLTLDAAELFGADVNSDGSVNLGDAAQITAAFRNKFTITW
ncbi:MAG: InlB B-repeat-containing protein [Firmicutes bacterium]|nr:InlB B-repeat-containing protein [Bacillota bacterium]